MVKLRLAQIPWVEANVPEGQLRWMSIASDTE